MMATTETTGDAESVVCPLCQQEVHELKYPMHERVDRVVLDWIKRQHPEWVDEDGICEPCLELYRQMKAAGGHMTTTDEAK